jgi:hypothetical protein
MPKLPGHADFELSDAAHSLLYSSDLSKVSVEETQLINLRAELRIARTLVRVTYDRAMLQARRASPDGLPQRLKAAAEAETAMGVFERHYESAMLQIAALDAARLASKVTKKVKDEHEAMRALHETILKETRAAEARGEPLTYWHVTPRWKRNRD